MPASISLYPSFKEKVADGTIDLDTHTFKAALLGALGTYDAAHETLSNVSAQELAAGNGYLAGGVALANVTWIRSGATVTFDADDPAWEAVGGNIGPAENAVFYDDTATGDPLVCHFAFGEAKTAVAGAPIRILLNASGIFTFT